MTSTLLFILSPRFRNTDVTLAEPSARCDVIVTAGKYRDRKTGRERKSDTERERNTEREIKISIISERITNRDYSHIKLFSLFISFITNLDDSFRASALSCCYNDVTPSRWFC